MPTDSWPLPSDYEDCVHNPDSFFDPELANCQPVLDAKGQPVCASGNFAIVFKMKSLTRSFAVKCFIRPISSSLEERYEKLKAHIRRRRSQFMVDFDFLPKGVLIHGDFFPLVKMDWVEGGTLRNVVIQNLDSKGNLLKLCGFWERLAIDLSEADLTHGDLHPGNVLWEKGSGPNRFRPRLVDYDGIWIKDLSNTHPGECGTPNYQHPLRNRSNPTYCQEVDRFSLLAIYTALRSLAIGGKDLWTRFDNGENLLFTAEDFMSCRKNLQPKKSELLENLWNHRDEALKWLAGRLILSAHGALELTPLLYAIVRSGQRGQPGDVMPLTVTETAQVERVYRTVVRSYRVSELDREIRNSTGRPWLRNETLRRKVQELLEIQPDRDDLRQLLKELPDVRADDTNEEESDFELNLDADDLDERDDEENDIFARDFEVPELEVQPGSQADSGENDDEEMIAIDEDEHS